MSRDLTDPMVRARMLVAFVRMATREPLDLTPGEISAYAAVAQHRRRLRRAARLVAQP